MGGRTRIAAFGLAPRGARLSPPHLARARAPLSLSLSCARARASLSFSVSRVRARAPSFFWGGAAPDHIGLEPCATRAAEQLVGGDLGMGPARLLDYRSLGAAPQMFLETAPARLLKHLARGGARAAGP